MTAQLEFFDECIPITIANIDPDQCRWPLGEPTHDMLMCGAPCEELRPYCSAHSQIAFVVKRER